MSRNRTPLRYPGGKQKVAPFVSELLKKNDLFGGDYVEPYAGGAGVAIELLLEGHVKHIHLNDASVAIHAFWRSVLDETDALCRRIGGASLTITEWRRQKDILLRPNEVSTLDLGFSLFYLNRCNRSGIPNAGVIGGLDQKGPWKMDARFSRVELVRRIEAIAAKKKQISIKNWDAEKFISVYLKRLPQKTLVYCDPPYYNKAARLYLNYYKPDDHARIAKVVQSDIKLPWLVSYDNAPEILNLYSARQQFSYSLQYSAGNVIKGTEIMVFSDLLKLPSMSKVPAINTALIAQ